MDATFATAHDALRYATGGNATLTVESARTGAHYTFRLRRPDPRGGDPREPPIFGGCGLAPTCPRACASTTTAHVVGAVAS